MEALLQDELGGRLQARRGRLVDALEGGAAVATIDGEPAGVVSWLERGPESAEDEAEIRVLVVAQAAQGRGIGGELLAAAERALVAFGVRRAWLVTTNDNLEALAFYQRRGWRLADLLPGAVDESRRTIKPGIGRIGTNGIPIRDELVLAKELDLAGT